MSVLSTLAQADTSLYVSDNANSASQLSFTYTILIVIIVISLWKIFEKAGEEGWKAIVPFYNSYTLFRIAGRNGWGFLLALIPIVNVVVAVMLSLDLAKHFGKSSAFGIVGLFLFSVVGFPMLAFGDAEYVGQKHE